MRPSGGLVSRGGVYGCWPEIFGSLGPMARSVKDLSKLLDVMVGYDPEDPITARGVSHIPESFTKFLSKDGLKGARLGILLGSFNPITVGSSTAATLNDSCWFAVVVPPVASTTE